MKKIILISLLIIGTVCYSTDKNFDSSKSNDSLKVLKKIVKNYVNGIQENAETVVYTYENGLVSEIVTTRNDSVITEDVEIKYEKEKLKQMRVTYPLLKIKKGDTTITQVESTITAIYNYNQDLISNLKSIQNNETHNTYFFYNPNKQLIRKQVIKDAILNTETNYTYNKEGNLLKEREANSEYTNFYKSYDNKNNPFNLIFPEAYLKIYKISKNNVISCNMDNKSYTYKYEYNSNNYPIKITQKINGKLQSITTIEYQ